MLNKLHTLLVLGFLFLMSATDISAQKKKNEVDLDTIVQQDSFRNINWMTDSFSIAIMQRKPAALLSLLPKYGIYLKYSKQVAPGLSNGTRSARYIYFRSRISKKHKKLRKKMKKEGLSFTKSEIQQLEVDSATNQDSITYCKIRVYYKRRKNKFFVECHGIKINNQWFLLDGFFFDRRD